MDQLLNATPFTSVELTDAINKLPYETYRFSEMFDEIGVRTTDVSLELYESRINLVKDSPRGSNPEYAGNGKRKLITLQTSHLAQASRVAPEDIQNVRAFGTTELASPATVVNDRLEALKRNIEMTRQHHRLGAMKGKIMDADGTTELLDLFSVFGVKQKKVEITFPATADDAENPVLSAILNAKRKAEEAMGGYPYKRFEAIVGSNFYDMLTGHALVRSYFQDWLSHRNNFGDNDFRFGGFTYGSVTFYEASQVVGGVRFVEPDKGHLYPVGNGLYKMYNAPADWTETVNTVGLPYYARMDPLPRGRGYDLEVQANPLTLCLYPEALVELTAKKS